MVKHHSGSLVADVWMVARAVLCIHLYCFTTMCNVTAMPSVR